MKRESGRTESIFKKERRKLRLPSLVHVDDLVLCDELVDLRMIINIIRRFAEA